MGFCHSQLKALFSADNAKDLQDMPAPNKHILGVTSLWMLVPIGYGLHHHCALSALLAAVCLVSTLFWSNPEGGSALHKADKCLSWVFCGSMLWCSFQDRARCGAVAVGALVACILVFFLLSDFFFRANRQGLQLFSHLLFRYAFYWWAHLLMVPAEEHFPLACAVVSVGYFGHVLFLYFFVDWKSPSVQQHWYCLSCIALLIWMGCVVCVHAMVSYSGVSLHL